ncbi:hypothetical protein VYU27_008934, partial [Nannochloropsis oceanica]
MFLRPTSSCAHSPNTTSSGRNGSSGSSGSSSSRSSSSSSSSSNSSTILALRRPILLSLPPSLSSSHHKTEAEREEGGGREGGQKLQRVGAPSVIMGWLLSSDRVLRTVRQGWAMAMGELLSQGCLEDTKANGFIRMMEGFARGQRPNCQINDPSAGVVPSLVTLLSTARIQDDKGSSSQGEVNKMSPKAFLIHDAESLYQRLTKDE